MIVRTLDTLPPDRVVTSDTWTSRRLLLAGDRMGFSLHDTVLRAGTETPMRYRNHLEAVYCIEGRGEIRDLETGEVHPIGPGTVYALDRHDPHVLVAHTDLRMVCVFDPPLTGPESHDSEGSYPLLSDEPPDPYASRVASTWSAVPRQEPVVHGDAADGPLSPAQVASFEEDGFLCLEGWFDEAAVARALEAASALADQGGERVVLEPDSTVVRSVFRVHRGHPALEALCRDPRMAGAARQLLGGPVYLHQSRVNFKPPLDGRQFAWHSDFETWHVEDGMPRMRAVTACLMLTPSTAFNGPLLVIPGSHRTYVTTVGATPERHHEVSLRDQRYGVPSREALEQLVAQGGIRSCEGAAGTVVLFDCNTMHGSGGNLSPAPRTSLFYVYNSVDNQLRAPYSGQPPRPDHIAERSPVPV